MSFNGGYWYCMKNILTRAAGMLIILAGSFLVGFFACGSSATSTGTGTGTATATGTGTGTGTVVITPQSLLVGEWTGTNSTNNCLAAADACYNTKYTVTFTTSGTYSIVSGDGGVDAGTFIATATTITTTATSIKTSACFTKDFLAGVAYTLSVDGKTLTIPVCPLLLTKK